MTKERPPDFREVDAWKKSSEAVGLSKSKELTVEGKREEANIFLIPLA